MTTSKARAMERLASSERSLVQQVDRCRREIEARGEWLVANPEWTQRPAAQHAGHTWEDSLRLAEERLETVRRAKSIAADLPEHHPALYTSDAHIGGSTEFLIKRLQAAS